MLFVPLAAQHRFGVGEARDGPFEVVQIQLDDAALGERPRLIETLQTSHRGVRLVERLPALTQLAQRCGECHRARPSRSGAAARSASSTAASSDATAWSTS